MFENVQGLFSILLCFCCGYKLERLQYIYIYISKKQVWLRTSDFLCGFRRMQPEWMTLTNWQVAQTLTFPLSISEPL
jgi:hypothetical protein